MPDLIPVHGGLDAPVSRTVPLSRRKQFLAETVGCADRGESRGPVDGVPHCRRNTVAADWTMDEDTWHYVLDHGALDFGFGVTPGPPHFFPGYGRRARQLRSVTLPPS